MSEFTDPFDTEPDWSWREAQADADAAEEGFIAESIPVVTSKTWLSESGATINASFEPIPVVATPVPDAIQRTELAVLSIDADAKLEAVQAAITAVGNIKRLAKELDDNLKPRLIAYIQQHGEFMIGDERYYVAPDKEVKCLDMPAVVRLMLGMDIDTMIDCLSKNAFKPAATMKALPPADAERLFQTTVGTVLKVQVVNEKFLK